MMKKITRDDVKNGVGHAFGWMIAFCFVLVLAGATVTNLEVMGWM